MSIVADHNIKLQDHLGLVVCFIKKRYQLRCPIIDSEEYADGCLGLMDAIRTYDPSSGYAFSTYAVSCIKNAIYKGKRKQRVIIDESQDIYKADLDLDEPNEWFFAIYAELPETNETERIDKQILWDYLVEGGTLDSVGKKFGVTRSRVAQRLARIQGKIRGMIADEARLS